MDFFYCYLTTMCEKPLGNLATVPHTTVILAVDIILLILEYVVNLGGGPSSTMSLQ